MTTMSRADEEAPLVWRGGQPVARTRLLSEAGGLARRLEGDERPLINLCQDRYSFLLAFCAALIGRRMTVLPPSPLPEVLVALEAELGGAFRIDDDWVALHRGADDGPPGLLPEDDFPAVTLYTSGSTGQSRGHIRHWQQLQAGAQGLRYALGLDGGHHLLATVPPQHMFGLETSIILPLLEGQAVAASQPLFPEDVRAALAGLPGPRGLITTPVHLRACLQESLEWPAVDFILSATAPLEPALARMAEERMGAPVHEIYGSTETGALATRRPVHEECWRPLSGVELHSGLDGWYASGDHFPECRLGDRLEADSDGRFRLLGRDGDLVKVAGKRHSLSALSALLQEAPGVQDAVMLAPEQGLSEQRLTGLVVPGDVDLETVRVWLRQRLDGAFMPRPLVAVGGLPRNASGKLPRKALEELVAQLKETRGG